MPERFGEQFLHQQTPELHISQPVEHEQARKKIKGEEISPKPAEKIADWLELLERTHTGHRDQPEVLERIKRSYHKQYVIKPDNIPESYWDLQRKIIVSEGRGGDFEKDKDGKIIIPDEVKEQAEQVLISDQEKSLDKWLDYLTSPDADVYPMWAKYWAFTSMTKMGKLEKKEDEDGQEFARFQKRTKDTVSPFPPLNPRALAMTIGVIEERAREKQKTKQERGPIENKSVKLDDKEFQALLSTENFSKIYSQFLIEMPEYSTEGLKNIQGKWIKYDQGSRPDKLVESLEGHPLEWCTANPDTARTQLEGGDFYVYYSYGQNDEPEKPSIPRIAIRMEGESKIAEVRGIAGDQNFDPYIAPVLEKKLSDFGQEGERYQKASADMKRLTTIGEKMAKGQELAKDDLIFLYEIDSPIEGFGYQKDPRIKELRDQRNPEEDAPIVLDCQKEEIAYNQNDINKNTKAYIGPLFPNIFQLNLEHIYTAFPEGKIRQIEATIGGQSKEDLIEEMKTQFKISPYAESMLKNADFTVSQEKENLTLIRLKVQDLGFSSGATTKEIFEKAEELGLELCPAETGPQLRKQYLNQPMNEWFSIAMKPISDSGGNADVFRLARGEDGLWLVDRWTGPDGRWRPVDVVVFRLRQVFPEA
ncbi:MAG: hypothetical protein BWY53_00749 [Parcubacteria group bacterium ADurb.Bin326]|nr:MAG: hypothetical protein BWY53_00749 [Parcubacteria group bacterium ADurb.Bin326]